MASTLSLQYQRPEHHPMSQVNDIPTFEEALTKFNPDLQVAESL